MGGPAWLAIDSTQLTKGTTSMDARSVLRSPTNLLGDKFNPTWVYSLLSQVHDGGLIAERVAQGWSIQLDNVPGGNQNGDVFVLLGRPGENE